MSFLTTLLSPHFKKEQFSCGNLQLDGYLHKQANQDMKRKLSVCFVLSEADLIKGYYTLSNSSIKRDILPETIIKKLPPSYSDLPVTLLGRLAVDLKFGRSGIGKTLLIDALKRSYLTSITSIASMAVIVDPIDDKAVSFYLKYGFITLPESGKMFLPMTTLAQLFPEI